MSTNMQSHSTMMDRSLRSHNHKKRRQTVLLWWLFCLIFQFSILLIQFRNASRWQSRPETASNRPDHTRRDDRSERHSREDGGQGAIQVDEITNDSRDHGGDDIEEVDGHDDNDGRDDGDSEEDKDEEKDSEQSIRIQSNDDRVPKHRLEMPSGSGEKKERQKQRSHHMRKGQHTAQDELSMITDTFRKALNAKLYYQTQTWNMLAGSELDTRAHIPSRSAFASDDDGNDSQIRDLLRLSPRLKWQRQTAWSNFDAVTRQQRQTQQKQVSAGQTPKHDSDRMIWDNEGDISSYFNHLLYHCGRSFNAFKDPTFQQRCWDSLIHLVDAPRCTTQLDSTFTCDGDAIDSIQLNVTGTVKQSRIPALRRIQPQKLIRGHFLSTENSINVVIIGAGPVGLFLANVLAQVNTLKTPVRVLVFEKRTSQTGRKKPYERNWLTEIPASYFGQSDPRIVKFLRVVHEDICDPGGNRGGGNAAAKTVSNEKEKEEKDSDEEEEATEEASEEEEDKKEQKDSDEEEEETEEEKDDEKEEKEKDKRKGKVIDDAAEEASEEEEEEEESAETHPEKRRRLSVVDADDSEEEVNMYGFTAAQMALRCQMKAWESHTSLPIKFYETLLLLSNRDLGVKFIYEDVTSYKDMLAAIPNMIVFDASGHRMDPLQKGFPNDEGAHSDKDSKGLRRQKHHKGTITVSNWTRSEGNGYEEALRTPLLNKLSIEAFTLMQNLDMQAKVARHESKQGTILYPVTRDTHEPFVLRMLKINDSRQTRAEKGLYSGLNGFMSDVMVSQHPLCKYCGEHVKKGCLQICRLGWPWDTIGKYRIDIGQTMAKHPPGFSTMVSILTLTARQHDSLMYLTKGGSTSMPLTALPLDSMKFDPIMRENNLVHLLRYYARFSTSDYPVLSVFSYVPYIYTDPLVPITATTDARIGKAPLLRVGDSMWTGNPNWANGLTMHIGALHKFSKLLNAVEAGNDDDDRV